MRCQTAAKAKFKSRYVGAPLRERPKEGSVLRQTFDLLQANKGRTVEIVSNKSFPIGIQIIQLENFYGLDVRLVRQGHKGVGRLSTYVLAGEWFGRVYIDYIAERIEEKTQ
jgi:hypothetical protein